MECTAFKTTNFIFGCMLSMMLVTPSWGQTYEGGASRTLMDHENAASPGQGHTNAKHVGKSFNYLRDRCNSEALFEVSTFSSLASANSLVRSALSFGQPTNVRLAC